MYSLSDKAKKKIVNECFDDVCESAQKEEAGTFKGIVNSVARPNVYFDEEKSVAVIEKNHNLSVNYIYKLSETKRRIQIIQKLEDSYIFEIELNGEKLTLECDQYSCKQLD